MSPEHFRNLMIGLVLIIGAVLTWSYSLTESNNWKHIQNSAGKTKGTITEIYAGHGSIFADRMAVRVAYEVDGVPYNERLATYTKDMAVGKDIPVYYLKNAPNVTVSRPDYINALYCIAGVQLLIGALVLIIDPET